MEEEKTKRLAELITKIINSFEFRINTERLRIDRERFRNESDVKKHVNRMYSSFDSPYRTGNRIRHLVRIISKAYEKNPIKLRKYFNHTNKFIAGISTAAYHFLTGDIKPIQTREFGGLGAIINDSEENLVFNKSQLWYAKLSGNALKKAHNSDRVLFYSENSGHSLYYSNNKGRVLELSKNSDYALECSENKYALFYSLNKDHSLKYSKNRSHTMFSSINLDNALERSENNGSLTSSVNLDNTLENSKYVDCQSSKYEGCPSLDSTIISESVKKNIAEAIDAGNAEYMLILEVK